MNRGFLHEKGVAIVAAYNAGSVTSDLYRLIMIIFLHCEVSMDMKGYFLVQQGCCICPNA